MQILFHLKVIYIYIYIMRQKDTDICLYDDFWREIYKFSAEQVTVARHNSIIREILLGPDEYLNPRHLHTITHLRLGQTRRTTLLTDEIGGMLVW